MKAKILSLLLLVSMLITAVPVMVSAEEAAVPESQAEAPVLAGYNDMYVKDGLTALYTIFGDKASTASIATGKWTDLISGATATMGDAGHWRAGEFGGIGFNTYRGNMQDADSDGYKETFNPDDVYGQNYNNAGLNLNFGIAQLPTGDFTVEYLAMYKPVYVYDRDEADKIARDQNGNKIEVFSFDNQANGLAVNKSLTAITVADIDQFGWFTSYSTAIDSVATWGSYTDAQRAERRGIIFWMFNNHTWYFKNGNSIGANYWNETIMDKANNVFQQNNAINTYSVSLDETLTVAEDGTRTTTGLFSLYRNGAFFSSNASDLNTTAKGEGVDGGYFDIDTEWTANQSFRLSTRRPTDFFMVRIYDRALSDVEKQQNNAVDILQWYGIGIPAADLTDSVKMTAIYEAVAGTALEKDASAKAAAKAALEEKIAAVTFSGAQNTLYVQDGLSSLFTAFAGETGAAVKGASSVTWVNRVAGKDNATFVGSAWQLGANGGIGRDVIYGTLYTTVNGDGSKSYTYGAHNDRNTYWATNNHKLSLGLDLLPKDDFTVEYLAFFPPQYTVDNATGNLIPSSEAETILNCAATGHWTNPADGSAVDLYPYELAWVDRIGFLAFITDAPHGHIESQPAGTLRPRAEDSGCKQWGGTAGNGGDVYGWGDISFSVDNRNIGRIATYGLSRDEATTYDENGVATLQTAVYAQLQDGTVLKSKTFTTANGKIANSGTNTGSQYFFGDDDTDFYLSYKIGAHYYALRVYDRVLTEDEHTQNNAADVYYFYGLSLSDELLADEKAADMMVTLLAGQSFERDASAYAAKKAELQAELNKIAALVVKGNELTSLYAASENLVALFSIYAPESLNIESGSWMNLVGDGAASFEDTARWSVNANGSVGYTAWIGSIADDGATENTVVGNDTAYMGLDGTNHGRKRAAKLNLGLDLLPDGDMTVEFMAMAKPVYVADAEESSASKVVYAKDANGDYLHAYNVFGAQYFNFMDYGTPANIAIDQVGYFGTISPVADGAYWGGGRGAVHWMLEIRWDSDRTGVGSGGAWGGSWGLNVNGNPFWTHSVIRTYGIYVDETVTGDVTEAVLGMYRNTTYYNSNSDKPIAYEYAEHTASNSGFYLSAGRPTDFYGARVYNKVLTDAEKQRNHMVDLALYYDVTIPKAVRADDELMQQAAALCVNVAFATDASAMAAARAELSRIFVGLGSDVAAEMLNLYAQSEHITSLYTVYEPATVNLATGKWTDLIGGKQATFGDASLWKMGEHGGVGFNVFYGTMTAEGTFDATGYNTTNNANVKLAFDVQSLSTEDFTVEYNVLYKPVYVYDAEQADGIARDESGNKLETYVVNGNTPDGAATKGIAIDRFGWFSSWTNNIAGNYYGMGRGGLIWLWSASAWGGNNSKWVGDNWTVVSANTMSPSSDSFTKDNAVGTYGFSVDETRTSMEGSDDIVTALVTLHRNGVKYRDNANVLQSTANGGGSVDGGYLDRDFTSDEYFWLSCARPTDFYTVRVYDTVLTADEKVQNFFVDMLYYYGIEIPETLYGNDDALVTLGNELKSLGMATDASAKAANKATIQAAIAALTKTVTVKIGSAIVDTLEVVGNTVMLPEIVDGKYAIGWRVNGGSENVAPGKPVAITGDMTAVPTLFTLPVTNNTQSVRYTDTASELGLRFTAELSRHEYTNLLALYGAESIKLGMLITPDAYVQMADGVFTRDALLAMVAEKGSASGAAYLQINSPAFYTVGDDILTLAGTINNFRTTTYNKNPAFAAVAFIDVDTDDDGIYDITIYGNYDQSNSATVKDALTNAYENATNTQKGWIDSLLKNFGA